jgi:predicted dehydrogenase
MPEQLRVGVVGCGRMGAFHIRNYGQIDCARLVAVADPDAETRRKALGETQVLEYSDWRDMIEHGAGELDAISIASPSELHATIALEALAAGLHVLVEKPIATTLPDALRMRGAAMEADRKLMVGTSSASTPPWRSCASWSPPAASARSTVPTRPGSARCRRGFRTPAWRSTSPPTTLT